ncbi:MAG: ABC transporter permease [Solirubrobacteraceae bacterium]
MNGAAARRLRTAATGLRSAGDGTVTLLAVVLAFAAGAFVIAVSDDAVLESWGDVATDPLGAIEETVATVADAYWALIRGAILDPQGASLEAVLSPLSETVVTATPLMLSGLAVTLAFRAGLFNIGGQGQAVVGAAAAAFVGFHFNLAPGIHLAAALAAGILAGAVWGGVPGWLKGRTGAHEVITTIMLNYVATILIVYLLAHETFRREGRADAISPLVRPDARLPHLLGGDLRLHAGLLVALAAAAAVGWLLARTTAGFELRATGLNLRAAETAGMRPARVYLVAMAVAGGLAGLAGATQMLGTDFTLTPGVATGIGFTGISVALLGRATVKGTVAASLLFGGLQAGGIQMQASTGTPVDLVTIIQGLIVLFIAAPLLVRSVFRLRAADASPVAASTARGWS